MPQKPKVELFTDGSCLKNPGPGGWACLMRYGKKEKMLKGGMAETTNNQMEMMAIIQGLIALKKPCNLIIHTDSKYVLDGYTKWLKGWKARGWRKSDKKPILNLDLWQQLDKLAQPHTIEWIWVKGHSGHTENELVDDTAREEATLWKKQLEQ